MTWLVVLFQRLSNEPALLASVAEAIVAIFVAFGLDLPGDDVGGVMAVIALFTGIVIRQTVHGPRSVDRLLSAEAVIDAARLEAAHEPLPPPTTDKAPGDL